MNLEQFKKFWSDHKFDLGVSTYDSAVVSRLKSNGKSMFPKMLYNLISMISPKGHVGIESSLAEHNIISSLSLANTLLLENNLDKHYYEQISQMLSYITENIHKLSEYNTLLTNADLIFNHEFNLLLSNNNGMIDSSQKELFAYHLKSYIETAEKRFSDCVSFHDLILKAPQTLYSLECIPDNLIDIEYLQKYFFKNKNIFNNSASTAKYYEISKDPTALEYLEKVIHVNCNNCAMILYPAINMEYLWVCANLIDGGIIVKDHFLPILTTLNDDIKTKGLSGSPNLPLDPDDTSRAFFVLNMSKIKPNSNIDILEKWWNAKNEWYDTYQKCFTLTPDISSAIHVLRAYMSDSSTSYETKCKIFTRVTKLLSTYLIHPNNNQNQIFWKDRWNTTPFYPTCEVLHLLCDNYDFVKSHDEKSWYDSIVNWVLESQNDDDGFESNLSYGSTPEETAYAILGLKCYYNCMVLKDEKTFNKYTIKNAISHGIDYLNLIDCGRYNHPPFWVGKSLYAPINIIQSAIVGALNLHLVD